MAKDPWFHYLPWRGFYEALRQGNTRHVMDCLTKHFDFRLPVSENQNALEFAAYHGQVQVVHTILEGRQFKLLCAKDKTSYLLGALKSSCKRGNRDMIKYLLSRKDQLFHMKWRNVIRRKLFDLHLAQEEDDILDYLIDDDNHPNDFYRGDYEMDLKKSFFGTARDRRIRRQEIVWIMKNCKIDREEVCAILDVDLVLLESCIGNPQRVSELLDDWLDNEERFVDIKFEVRESPPKRGLESYYQYSTHKLHWRPEVIAARSGRADLVELFLGKAKMKYPTIDIFSDRKVPWASPDALSWINSERCSRKRFDRIIKAWSILIHILAHEQISDVSVLRCLPQEAFSVDGTRPQDLDSDSFHRLPLFFLTQKQGVPGMDEVRALLNTALQRGYPEIFKFYLDRYQIHEDHVKITGDRRWHILSEDMDWYPFEDEHDQWLGGVQWNEMSEGPCPISCLSKFPVSMIVQLLDRTCFTSMIIRGDVRTIQSLNQHYGVLDAAGDSFVRNILRFKRESRMPLPALEYIFDYYHHEKHGDAEVRSTNVRRFAVKELITAPSAASDSSEIDILYSREVLRIMLSRFYPGRDVLEDYQTHGLSDDEDDEFELITNSKVFKAAREAKARRYVGEGQDIPVARMTKTQRKQYNRIVKGKLKDKEARYETYVEEFGRETSPYRGAPYLKSLHREELLRTTLWLQHKQQMGLLISAMELHDFRLDFGPRIGDVGTLDWSDWLTWKQWTTFLRDFILGLSGSRKCFIYWPESLSCMSRTKSTLKRVLLHHQIYELLANTGVVIVDTDFYDGDGENLEHLPDPFPEADRDYLEALSREHPEITAQRRNLSLSARCRIVIHESLRKSPGFQSDKIRSLKLPEILERFLLFSDLKDNWDNLNYRKSIMREASLGNV